MRRGLFVTYSRYLGSPVGGVQLCTREYAEVISAAGISLDFCTFESDNRISTRALRRVISSPYFRPAEPGLVQRIAESAADQPPDFLFLNQVSLAPLASRLRRVLPPDCRTVLLSHGLESTDMVNAARAAAKLPIKVPLRPIPALAIGYAVLTEVRSRADIDVVCTLSPFDRDLEEWLGARRTAWLPRVVASNPLDWRPSGDRVGLVGTLDHAPNLEGVLMVLDALRQRDAGRLRVRLIGGPPQIGRWIAEKYPAVDYLGPLDDGELAKEASSWNAFIHPLFCRARGCSTKLAIAIGWHIPIVTTTVGHRGYEWRKGHFAVADDPSSFVDICLRLLSREAADAARLAIIDLATSSPSVPDVALRLRSLLEL